MFVEYLFLIFDGILSQRPERVKRSYDNFDNYIKGSSKDACLGFSIIFMLTYK